MEWSDPSDYFEQKRNDKRMSMMIRIFKLSYEDLYN